MKFELLEKYRKHKEEREKTIKQLQNEIKEAQGKLKDLKQEYNRLIHQTVKGSYNSDDYKNKKLIRLEKNIQKAEIELKVAKDKLAMKRKTDNEDVISKEQLLEAFNKEFTPGFREQELAPVLEAMLEVKELAEEVAKEYRRVVNLHDNQRDELISVLGDRYMYKPLTVEFNLRTESEKYKITEKFARKLKY